jgi:hypothetical protein
VTTRKKKNGVNQKIKGHNFIFILLYITPSMDPNDTESDDEFAEAKVTPTPKGKGRKVGSGRKSSGIVIKDMGGNVCFRFEGSKDAGDHFHVHPSRLSVLIQYCRCNPSYLYRKKWRVHYFSTDEHATAFDKSLGCSGRCSNGGCSGSGGGSGNGLSSRKGNRLNGGVAIPSAVQVLDQITGEKTVYSCLKEAAKGVGGTRPGLRYALDNAKLFRKQFAITLAPAMFQEKALNEKSVDEGDDEGDDFDPGDGKFIEYSDLEDDPKVGEDSSPSEASIIEQSLVML